jgi:hypothetical protein
MIYRSALIVAIFDKLHGYCWPKEVISMVGIGKVYKNGKQR